MLDHPISLDIPNLLQAYRNNSLSPEKVVEHIIQRREKFTDRNIWITPLSKEQIIPYIERLNSKNINDLPLYGIPFAIKDNIDLAGVATTAACPEFSYVPKKHAYVVQQLIDAGAIPVGKTNMDQFATGLVGTRSPEPWGPCGNAFDPKMISGGSSSGSAVAVALGLCSFSLGTDTAGSGRVPAMLNNLYGHKPSRGLLSMSGVVPACRTLDCPSILALSAYDANSILSIVSNLDPQDAYSRQSPYVNGPRYFGTSNDMPIIGIPDSKNLEFFGDLEAAQNFNHSVKRWKELGATLKTIDITPLLDAAKLLYAGPWVAERYAAVEGIIQKDPMAMHSVVREIILQAEGKTAVEAFNYEYKMQSYRRLAEQLFQEVDCLLTPTAPTHYSILAVLDNPIELNSNMGYYTNYMNLLDLCGIAIPSGMLTNGLPFGFTLCAPAMQDRKLLSYAHYWQTILAAPSGTAIKPVNLPKVNNVDTKDTIDVAVCGAHLSGMPLNWQLTERGAQRLCKTKTSKQYRLFALAGGPPERPALVRDSKCGTNIEIEIWSIPSSNLGSFLSGIPAPLGLGKIETIDGEWVVGFISEPCATKDAQEITHLGSWRTYLDG